MEPLSPVQVRNASLGLLCAIAMVADHLRRQASAAWWETAGFVIFGCFLVAPHLMPRRRANRFATVILLLVFGGGVLAWGFGSSPALRMSALGVAVGAFATFELLTLKFGVPVPDRPDPDSPITLNLSSR
jgi:hypothetical protein